MVSTRASNGPVQAPSMETMLPSNLSVVELETPIVITPSQGDGQSIYAATRVDITGEARAVTPPNEVVVSDESVASNESVASDKSPLISDVSAVSSYESSLDQSVSCNEAVSPNEAVAPSRTAKKPNIWNYFKERILHPRWMEQYPAMTFGQFEKLASLLYREMTEDEKETLRQKVTNGEEPELEDFILRKEDPPQRKRRLFTAIHCLFGSNPLLQKQW